MPSRARLTAAASRASPAAISVDGAAWPRSDSWRRSAGCAGPSWNRHDESRARLLADPPVAVRLRRAEVDGVPAVEEVVLARDAQRELPLEDVQEFDAGVLVRTRLLGRHRLEL